MKYKAPSRGKIILGWPHKFCGYEIKHTSSSSFFYQTFRKIPDFFFLGESHLKFLSAYFFANTWRAQLNVWY